MALSLYTGKRLLVLVAHGAIDNRTAVCVAGFGNLQWNSQADASQNPSVHATRTANRNDQSTTYGTISDRMTHPRSTTPQTQTVTEQKETRSWGVASSRKKEGQKSAAFQHGCRRRIALFSSKTMISFDRNEPRRNETRRSGRKSTATDTTARQPRGHQAAGARAPLPIPRHISHETRMARRTACIAQQDVRFRVDGWFRRIRLRN